MILETRGGRRLPISRKNRFEIVEHTNGTQELQIECRRQWYTVTFGYSRSALEVEKAQIQAAVKRGDKIYEV